MGYAIRTVGVVGGGTMGGGITALTIRCNRPVVLKEESPELAQKVEKSLHDRFQKWFDLGYTKERSVLDQQKSYLTVTYSIQDLVNTDLIIEAIPENMEWKKELFFELDRIMPEHVILASNTSSLPITEIARATKRPDKVVGMHFFNPPTSNQRMLVELVRGGSTSSDTMDTVEKFSRATLGKKTIRVKDRFGFLVNCLLLPYLGEAVMALEQSDVSFEAIDAEARNFGWPMGPFGVLDVVGLDTAYLVAEFLSRAYPEKIQLGTLFKALVDAGRLGEKAGVGFYDMKGGHEPLNAFLQRIYGSRPIVSAQKVFERMTARFLNESVQALQDGVTSKNEIETGAKIGIGFPKDGPLHHISKLGASTLVKQLNGYVQIYGPRFKPAQMLVDMAVRGEKFYEILL
ncbi:MAG: hypothetical protein HYX22_02995 [Candidatus Yanofskybacteria bacterium]|nr:hypothetical protein [Candidatus Yanofskybacteria bacterium]